MSRRPPNSLLRQGLQRGSVQRSPVALPTLPGPPRTDITDTSAVLAEADDDHGAAKGVVSPSHLCAADVVASDRRTPCRSTGLWTAAMAVVGRAYIRGTRSPRP